jgi:hypothetical protein
MDNSEIKSYSDEIEMENYSEMEGDSSFEEPVKINGILKNNTNYYPDQRYNNQFNANPIESYRTYKIENCQTKFPNNKIIENKNNLNNNLNLYNNLINNINDSGTVNLDENSENTNYSNALNLNQNNNNSDSNDPTPNFNDNSIQINNIPKNHNLSPNNNIRFKTRKSRKYDDDLLIKKHKGKFFRYIREILNKILIKYNIKAKFNFFPKILKEGTEKNTFKKILELKLIEFINFEIMEKITYKKGQKKIQISKKNKKLYEFLKDKQDIKFQIILKDLHNEYLKTAQYKKEINELEPHYDNEYMDLYKKNAEGFINYFFEDKKIKKHK